MQIFLTGMPGCGKTYWAQRIAMLANIPFMDLDKYIEQEKDTSIDMIFETQGESAFRLIETFYLHRLTLKYPTAIIATGGGTPCFAANMLMMNRSGTTFYLKVPIEKLVERLIADHHHRPLIKNRSEEQMKLILDTLLTVREKFYLQSKHIIDMNQIDETTFAQNFVNKYV